MSSALSIHAEEPAVRFHFSELFLHTAYEYTIRTWLRTRLAEYDASNFSDDRDDTAHLSEINTPSPITMITGEADFPYFIYTGHVDGVARKWNVKSGCLVKQFEGNTYSYT